MHILQETLITFLFLTLDATFSKTLSFYNHCIEQLRSDPLELNFFVFKISILKFFRLSPRNVLDCGEY